MRVHGNDVFEDVEDVTLEQAHNIAGTIEEETRRPDSKLNFKQKDSKTNNK